MAGAEGRAHRRAAVARAAFFIWIVLGCQSALDLDAYTFNASGAGSSDIQGSGGVSSIGEAGGTAGMPAAEPGTSGLPPRPPCAFDETMLDGCVLAED